VKYCVPGPNNADLTKIKTIYHYQNLADGVEHTVWIDELRAIKAGSGGTGEAPEKPQAIKSKGHDSRIDLRWRPNLENDLAGYYVYRSESQKGLFSKLNNVLHSPSVYSDFFGGNNKNYFYYVTAVSEEFMESVPSDTVSATSYAMTDEELMVSVQEATFRYFYDFGHPVSGLALERNTSQNTCTSGGTGMGLVTLMVGAERGFETREALKILSFMQNTAQRYHGVWPHWINGNTGETIPFSPNDNGADLVETAYFVQGLLSVRKYFDGDDGVETEIRTRATQMWEEVEWDWFRRESDTDGKHLYWHWSPDKGWIMNMQITGYNEAMIVYLLAIASTTHSVPASLYFDGWAGNSNYVNGNNYYGYTQWVGFPYGGPLFFTHYTFLTFDPRNKSDIYCNYFDNNRNISLINRAYCINNPEGHAGYSDLVWGLTASDNPWGYSAQEPTLARDNGTITPTAAISAMPYTPEESMATLKHFYHEYGHQLWGEFGFHDAFNLDENWFAKSYLAIDQGTIVPMIENHLTQLCWDTFMANDEINTMLDAIGWVTAIDEDNPEIKMNYALHQNYPNPFNPSTVIRYKLAKADLVELSVYNALGQKVITLVETRQSAGVHKVQFDAKELSSGVYYYRIKSGEFNRTRKMVLIH